MKWKETIGYGLIGLSLWSFFAGLKAQEKARADREAMLARLDELKALIGGKS